jgi:hypothetical protein
MNLCSKNHEEVCFESRYCPACEVATERDAFEEECTTLKEQLADLQNDYRALEQEVPPA